MRKEAIYPIFQAIIAAILFGASAPFSKLFLGKIEPIPMACFLYFGSGIGLLLLVLFQRIKGNNANNEALISRNDIPWLIGSLIAGGVLAPIILMFSLKNTPASTASLLLNFECVMTALIAAIAFKEAIGKRIWLAVVFITIASILISIDKSSLWGFSMGAVGIVLACTFWGIDNNFTRNISAKDPFIIVAIKGLGAGAFSFFLALYFKSSFPAIQIILGAMTLGCFSYGFSIVLFISAMRNLGAARTSALFGIAPFIGCILSFLLFRETPNFMFFIGVSIMILGAFLLLSEDHSHEHSHTFIEHEHKHSHSDGHHNHHEEIYDESHSHMHIHKFTKHCHPHTPDIHHRHIH